MIWWKLVERKDSLGLEIDRGYVVADKKMKTNVGGVFATGDIRDTPMRQMITAGGDGAVAIQSVYRFLMKNSWEGRK